MTHLSDVMVELTDAAQLISIRPSHTVMATGLVHSICDKIHAITVWGAGSAHTLCAHIQHVGFDGALAEQLNAAIDTRMTRHMSNTTTTVRAASGAPKREQVMRSPNLYLTADDWAVIDDADTPPDTRDSTVANRLRALGVKRASEDGCVKWAVALIVWAEHNNTGEWPSYRSTYNRVGVGQCIHPIGHTRSQHVALPLHIFPTQILWLYYVCAICTLLILRLTSRSCLSCFM